MEAQQPTITAQTARFCFYDIETLTDAFTLCAYTLPPDTSAPGAAGTPARLDVFWLPELGSELERAVDARGLGTDPSATQELVQALFEGNPAMDPATTVHVHDLRRHESNLTLARMFGLSAAANVNDPSAGSDLHSFLDWLRPACDTDTGYDPFVLHPYLSGYNSFSYDTTVLSLYLYEAFTRSKSLAEGEQPVYSPVLASRIRGYNDQMFAPENRKSMHGYLRSFSGGDSGSVPQAIRRSMIRSGRHLDVSRLNERQQRVPLKRQLGMLGRQIMESEDLSAHADHLVSFQDLVRLLVYNVSDVVGLSKLFEDKEYSGNFDLKRGLMDQYPETYLNRDKRGGGERPTSDRTDVRWDRMSPDSSSAQFVARILAPYAPLKDTEVVDLRYPHPEVAAATGRESVDVLDTVRDMFYARLDTSTPAGAAAKARFDEVYAFYDSIRGKNFNDSDRYAQDFPDSPHRSVVHVFKELPAERRRPGIEYRVIQKRRTNLPYVLPDGTPSTCFATFSTGGIHGAEINADAVVVTEHVEGISRWIASRARQAYGTAYEMVLDAKAQAWMVPLVLEDAQRERALAAGLELDDAGRLVVDPRELVSSANAKPTAASQPKWRKPTKKWEPSLVTAQQLAQEIFGEDNEGAAALARSARRDDSYVVLPDGLRIELKAVLTGRTEASARWKPEPVEPLADAVWPFKTNADGSDKLRKEYVYTSVAECAHEDFTSYYPNLLRNMRAFFNEALGSDRYAAIFEDKERYGKLRKDESFTAAERDRFDVLRNGTKLILNSASGAGDAGHDNTIRMNNTIIAMRLIGQLFSWWIGQAQTFAGARIISTNTDGLYSVLDAEQNDRILHAESANIGVDIEPERMMLVSKDSNNRLEMVPRSPDDKNPAERPQYPGHLKIIGAGGGTLGCWSGPSPVKSLNHPAVVDHVLAQYLRLVAEGHRPAGRRAPLSVDEPMHLPTARWILHSVVHAKDPVWAARMFQNVLAASPSSVTYPFALDVVNPDEAEAQAEQAERAEQSARPETDPDSTETSGSAEDPTAAAARAMMARNPRTLQKENRVFVVRPGTAGAVNMLAAGAWKVPAARLQSRQKQDLYGPIPPHPVGEAILEQLGYTQNPVKASRSGGALELIAADHEVTVRRITGLDPQWPLVIANQDLHHMPEQQLRALLDGLDLDVYLVMAAQSYEASWMNRYKGKHPMVAVKQFAEAIRRWRAGGCDPAALPVDDVEERLAQWYELNPECDLAAFMARSSGDSAAGSDDGSDDGEGAGL